MTNIRNKRIIDADLDCSMVGAEKTEFGTQFRVLIVLGKNEYEKARTSLLTCLYLEGFDLVGRGFS